MGGRDSTAQRSEAGAQTNLVGGEAAANEEAGGLYLLLLEQGRGTHVLGVRGDHVGRGKEERRQAFGASRGEHVSLLQRGGVSVVVEHGGSVARCACQGAYREGFLCGGKALLEGVELEVEG